MKKGNTFPSRFLLSLPAKAPVCWQLKIGLSARGNAQARPHYQTKLSSDVDSVYFWGVKSAAFLLFVIGGWEEGRRRRDRGLEKDEFVPYASPSHISLLLFCWATLHNYLWTCFIRKGPLPPLFHLRRQNSARHHRLCRCIFVTGSTTCTFIHGGPR